MGGFQANTQFDQSGVLTARWLKTMKCWSTRRSVRFGFFEKSLFSMENVSAVLRYYVRIMIRKKQAFRVILEIVEDLHVKQL